MAEGGRKKMKTKLMALMVMVGGALFAQTRVGIGVQFGSPAPVVVPAPMVDAYQPPSPGPGYVWVPGYYDAYGNWIDGYWTMPPYVGAYWIAPRLVGGHFYAGYWGGPRGVINVPAPRYAPQAYDRGFGRGPMPARGFDRAPARAPERSFDRGPARSFDRGGDRGAARGGNFRQGFRR
jgi:hypothetical protein